MNKSELIQDVANRTELPRKDVAAVIDNAVAAITDALKKRDKVTILGFGTFSVKHQPEHPKRHPKTGEIITVKEQWKVRFKPGKSLVEDVQ